MDPRVGEPVRELTETEIAELIAKYSSRGYPYTAIAGLYQSIMDGSDLRLLEAIGAADSETLVKVGEA